MDVVVKLLIMRRRKGRELLVRVRREMMRVMRTVSDKGGVIARVVRSDGTISALKPPSSLTCKRELTVTGCSGQLCDQSQRIPRGCVQQSD
jgi:hypothetical protein